VLASLFRIPFAKAKRLNRRPADSFVGRDDDMAIVASVLRGARLVTLVGTPGVGKTRLALEVAAAAAPSEFPGGVVFCDLTDAESAEDVHRAAARALVIQFVPAGAALDAAEQLGLAMEARGRALFIFDNFEQVVRDAPATIGIWLEATRDARFLVTSRERLRLRGERVHLVAPLTAPFALTLFAHRATAASGADLLPSDEPVARAIARELEGLPLAIELAAARIGVLTPRQLLDELPCRLDVLTVAPRDAADHQRTLRAAIDASFDRLTAWEQAALAACSVFRGGFSLEAAQRVLDLDAFEGAPRTLDVLQSLRDKSLLRADRVEDRTRFGLYVSIREHAAERLGREHGGRARGLHAAFYAEHGRLWAIAAGTGPTAASLAQLSLEQENLLAVVERGSSGEDASIPADTMLEALVALEPLLSLRGPLPSYLALLDRALARDFTGVVSSEVLARLLGARARVQRTLGRMGEAEGDLRAAIAHALSACEPLLEGTFRTRLAHLLHTRPPDAREEYARACTLIEPTGNAAALGELYDGMGALCIHAGDRAAARSWFERARDHLARGGDPRNRARNLGNIGLLCADDRRDEEALASFAASIELFGSIGDRWGEAVGRGNSATILQGLGRFAEATAEYDRALFTLRELGARSALAAFVIWRATLLHERGRVEEALEGYAQALDLTATAAEGGTRGWALGYHAAALADLGRVDEAARGFEEARAAQEGVGDHRALQALEVGRAHLERAAGRAEAAAAVVARARLRADAPSDVRLAIRLYDAAAVHAQKGLVVGAGSAWFQWEGEARVDLARRGALRLMLAGLCDAHERAPGAALRAQELFALGWPGEKANKDAAANRVRVALATLRKLGLRDALVAAKQGWHLETSIRVVRTADGSLADH
jgi:predicted ATPase